MKNYLLAALVISIGMSSCHKANDSGSATQSFDSVESDVIKDFATIIVFTKYSNLLNTCLNLQTSVDKLTNSPNDVNLAEARNNWKNMRAEWEQSEGFLMGPVESHDYDPNTDTWPTDYVQMDSLLASPNPLTTNDVMNLPQSLRGYHPLEYMLWGKGGSKIAANITDRQKTYMNSLIDDILTNNVQALYNDWFLGSDNYQAQVLTAGIGSTEFSTRRDLFLNIASAMSDICGEVGSGKMYEPFIAKDSTITESPYSGNTLIDFRNNILGLQQVYMGVNGGKSLKNLVAAKQAGLDQKIQAQINAAINSFSAIILRYEEAIFNQRTQVQQTMDQLAVLSELLETQLRDFIMVNIKD